MTHQALDIFLDSEQEEMVADICQLIRFPSISGKKEPTQACLEYFLQRAAEFGFSTRHTSNWDVGIVEMGEGSETLGILVHLDVVGIGDRMKWSHDPFEAVRHDGYLWGRGCVDDKGAAIMSLYAMKALQQLSLPMHRKIWLIAGTSEEAHWTDIDSYKNEFPLPDFGFSPDGDFPIFNCEKGYADIHLEFQRDGKRGIQKLQGGDNPNTVPSKAEIVLADGRTFVSHGVSVHSSMPEDGDNAILKLCRELESQGKSDFDFVRFINHFLQNSVYAKELNIDDAQDHAAGEFVGLTTAVPTVISLEEDSVHLTLNIRHKYGTTQDDILSALTAPAEDYGYQMTISEYLDPMMVSKELPFLRVMEEVADEYGVDGGFELAAGTTYAKAMPNFVSWGPILTGDPKTAHMEDEHLSLNTMLLATKMYARFIQRMTTE